MAGPQPGFVAPSVLCVSVWRSLESARSSLRPSPSRRYLLLGVTEHPIPSMTSSSSCPLHGRKTMTLALSLSPYASHETAAAHQTITLPAPQSWAANPVKDLGQRLRQQQLVLESDALSTPLWQPYPPKIGRQ
ncbi:hypothetical protein TEQG_06177 [Trichophyton equinum CBS 127.97]|uniref:Uncharacterized protein n=1 Tax=Trichophyton equinum (strain ATCC MYA-4606 / CBS 127.97) TaxID=559882 RepID=F2PZF0_TRIEC|nr:hypothetical protein TEQG_06177 [Trichophyton equinum CBS 127.97]